MQHLKSGLGLNRQQLVDFLDNTQHIAMLGYTALCPLMFGQGLNTARTGQVQIAVNQRMQTRQKHPLQPLLDFEGVVHKRHGRCERLVTGGHTAPHAGFLHGRLQLDQLISQRLVLGRRCACVHALHCRCFGIPSIAMGISDLGFLTTQALLPSAGYGAGSPAPLLSASFQVYPWTHFFLIKTMQIATWNVNSLSVRLPQVLAWLEQNPVDVLALQELKLTDDKFPFDALAEAGYQAAAHGQKTYNGVALLSRYPLREVVRNIPGHEDPQARVIAATVDTSQGPIRILNGYFVNGQAPGTEKFAYKMQWLKALHDWAAQEMQAHPQLALVGDFNVAPEDRDSYDPIGLNDTIHHTVEERTHFQQLLDLGLHDAFRLFEQPEKSFSWWDYRMLGFQKNRGLRIDHILITDALKQRAQECHIDRAPRKNQQPSDHAPVVLTLA